MRTFRSQTSQTIFLWARSVDLSSSWRRKHELFAAAMRFATRLAIAQWVVSLTYAQLDQIRFVTSNVTRFGWRVLRL